MEADLKRVATMFIRTPLKDRNQAWEMTVTRYIILICKDMAKDTKKFLRTWWRDGESLLV